MEEIWKPVPSHPELLASSFGRVMIKPYRRPMPQGNGSKLEGGKPTAGQWDGKRFIYPRRGKKTLKVARLVCAAFHGTPPQIDSVCMHLDENSRNNKPENLAWGTQKQNLNAPGFLQYCRRRIGEKNPRVKGTKV